MKKMILFGLMFASVITAKANNLGADLEFRSLNFAAPIVADRTALPGDTTFGTIVYDNNSAGFFGLTNDGSWAALGGAANVISSGSNEKIFRARIVIGTSTCTVERSSGNWVETTAISEGVCTLDFTDADFSSEPVCVVTGPAANYCAAIGVGSTTFAQIQQTACTTSAALNGQVNIICMGN